MKPGSARCNPATGSDKGGGVDAALPVIDATAQGVAQALAGGAARVISVQALSGWTGASTGALLLYQLDGGACFVEKRSRSAVEYALARAILSDATSGLPGCPAILQFLDATIDPNGGYRLFMEQLHGVGDNDSWIWGAEAQLVNATVAFSNAVNDMRQRHNLTLRPAPDVFGALTKVLSGAETGIGTRLEALRTAMAGYPLVLAHNDLFWPNIGRAPGSDALVFLDFALVGDNLPGADFHHFAKGLTKSVQHRAFFQTATGLAAARAGIPAAIIRSGACLNAATRACARETRRGKPEKGRHMAQRFFTLAEEALQDRGART